MRFYTCANAPPTPNQGLSAERGRYPNLWGGRLECEKPLGLTGERDTLLLFPSLPAVAPGLLYKPTSGTSIGGGGSTHGVLTH